MPAHSDDALVSRRQRGKQAKRPKPSSRPSQRSSNGSSRRKEFRVVVLCITSLIAFWLLGVEFFVVDDVAVPPAAANANATTPQRALRHAPQSTTCLSRSLPDVVVTTDVRGNLGPPRVLIQDPPGKDWIKDRWQAASNMHGTAIAGQHWVHMDLGRGVMNIQKIVLDWEAANSDDYFIVASGDQPIPTQYGMNGAAATANDGVWTLYNSSLHKTCCSSTAQSGQSPGVKFKLPLHITHELDISKVESSNVAQSIRYIKLIIRKPGKHGWGVSLWQFDVYGY
uniref:F5/8 type C domain-containing protein n=1 Tax=Craspedostauros australis TaxID=1486917 RepID=A0A7R9ZK09_9STRA